MRKLDHKDLAHFCGMVIGAYIDTGKDLTARELAERFQWTESKVRRYLTAGPGGAPPDGIRWFREARTSYSKDYPGMESGTHMVTTYGPSREKLRDFIITLEEVAKRERRGAGIEPALADGRLVETEPGLAVDAWRKETP